MSEDVSSKVKKIVADHLGIDEAKVTEESSFISKYNFHLCFRILRVVLNFFIKT